MTGRERLTNIINRRPVDRLCCSALIDLGIYCEFYGTSPLQSLIQYDMGMENFYSLLQDYEKPTWYCRFPRMDCPQTFGGSWLCGIV